MGADNPLVKEESRGEIKVRTAAGTSDGWKLWIRIDDDPPVITVAAPSGPVGLDKPFVCHGRWDDARGVRSITVNGVAGEGADNTKSGPWSVSLPGIGQPTVLEIVVTDNAGNQARQTLTVQP
jgi:hypothetical protein